MALSSTCVTESDRMISVLTPENLCQRFSALLNDQCTIEKNCSNKIRVLKRQRDLIDGDFVVPPGKDANLFSDEFIEQCRTTLSADLSEHGLKINSVSQSKHFPLTIALDKGSVFKRVITSVCHQRKSYGIKCKAEEHPQGRLLIKCAGLGCQSEQIGVPLITLRTVTLLKHVKQLLQVSGFSVSCIGQSLSQQTRKILSLFEVDYFHERKSEKLHKELKDCILKCKYRIKENKQDNNPSCPRESTSWDNVPDKNIPTRDTIDENVDLDLRLFITETPALRGYDKNINTVRVINQGEATDVLKEIISLESDLKTVHKFSEDKASATTVLHLTSHSRGYFQQQVDLVWRLLSPDIAKVNQVHLIHGTVQTVPKSQQLSSAIFYSKIREEIRQSTVVKYGSQVQGEGWERNIDVVTMATIMFDFLSSNCKNTLNISLPHADGRETPTKHSGTFVMYNAARLSTLFAHFQKAVEQGVYPDLPPVQDIDFSLLKEQDEWILLFNFVWPFPDMVSETVSNLAPPSSDRITPGIQTHKICTFLASLSQHLSAYYSRVHILGESRSHLYPLMFARLYLLKAVHQIFVNGLSLLEIEPLSQL